MAKRIHRDCACISECAFAENTICVCSECFYVLHEFILHFLSALAFRVHISYVFKLVSISYAFHLWELGFCIALSWLANINIMSFCSLECRFASFVSFEQNENVLLKTMNCVVWSSRLTQPNYRDKI